MRVEAQEMRDLPNELWLYILKIAAETEWPAHAFFPKADGLGDLWGFKEASSKFRALTDISEQSIRTRSVSIRRPRDLLEHTVPVEHIRHLLIEEDISRHSRDEWTLLSPHFVNLESLAIQCGDNSALYWLQATSIGKRLRRLDLTCLDMNLTFLDLDFPNLLELRISTVCPTTATTRAEDFLLETMGFSLLSFDFDVMSTVFIEMLAESLHKLRNLKLLSIHVALVTLQQFNFACQHHADRHESEQCDFRVCKLCPQFKDLPDIIKREAAASTSLARTLPKLERVRWTDPWKTEYYDEECQREYKIVRAEDGAIRSMLD